MSLFNITTYVIVNLFLFSSWHSFLFTKKHCLSFVDRLIGAFILGLSQIIFTEMLLGVLFKKLFPITLFLFNIAISLTMIFLAIKLQKSNALASKKKDVKPNFFRDILLELKNEAVDTFKIIKKDKILLWIFRIFLVAICWIIFLGYLFPSYTWDSLWYHLPIVGYVMQSGAIQENSTPSAIDLFINIFPKNIELFFLWNTIFLKSDIIVDLSQLLFTIIGVFTIYSIAIKLGTKIEHAIYSSLLFFFTPVVILQSAANYVDIAVAVLFLIAINFLLYEQAEKSTVSEKINFRLIESKVPLFLAGLSAGILLGSKGSGPLFIIVLLTVIAIQQLIIKPRSLFTPASSRRFGTGRAVRPWVVDCLLFLLPVLLMGGYWYIKNLMLYGNPVYPFKISFLNITLFRGLYEGIIDPLPAVLSNVSPLIRSFYVWQERVEYYLYDSRLSGFGPIWFILLLPSIVVALYYAFKKKQYNFFLVSAVLIMMFIIYPRNWYTRYVIFIVALGNLSFGLMLEYFKERQMAIKLITLLLVVYTFLSANSPCIMPWKIGEFLKLPPKERIIARHAPFNIDLQARQDYGLWIWVNNNMSNGNTLVYTFEPLFLAPLWNSGFSNKVVYVKAESYNGWLKKLKENHANHVLIKRNSIEDKWIEEVSRLVYKSFWWSGASKNFSENFKVVYSDENYKVLRFKN